ncbi:caspase family protein [Flammeovirga pacifica]|uniref:SPOR domain-containing protein n=1 Tax=Flammeovirga pacifica TaxID=915059 RepID=A0A1S1YY04_FLAPC|nr:caspase family protein [Flammeovirga pacifica]OHX65887.1 hypothetical protein NH26_05730 [Flammeovirga pacifica]
MTSIVRQQTLSICFIVFLIQTSFCQGLERKTNENISRQFALIIGTDKYNGKPDWADLQNPIFDAETIADVFINEYGYQTQILRNPDSNTLLNTIIDYHEILKKNDRFIIYIAGHGDYDERIFDDGFIVCHDSKPLKNDMNRKTYISYKTVSSVVNKLPAKQILLLLDVCFSGSFNSKMRNYRSAHRSDIYSDIDASAYAAKKMKLKTRTVITSGGLAPVLDGVAGQHSPFAYKLIEGLRVLPDQKTIITSNDLYSYVSRVKSQPIIGHFGDHEPAAEYIIGMANSQKGNEIKVKYEPTIEDFIQSRGVSSSNYNYDKIHDLTGKTVVPQKYYIQLLSESNEKALEESIDLYNQKLKQHLLIQRISIENKDWYRLFVGGYDDLNFAKKQLSELKQKHTSDKHFKDAYIKGFEHPQNDLLKDNTLYNLHLKPINIKGYGIQVFSDPSLSFTLDKARVYEEQSIPAFVEKTKVNNKNYYRLIIQNFKDKNKADQYLNKLKGNTEDVNIQGAYIRSF